jgi:hypothetical protein
MGRAKLSKGYSYPVKRSELDSALEKAGVRELGRVFYSSSYDDSEIQILRAFLMGETQQGYRAESAPLLSVYSVPSEQLAEIRRLLEQGDILTRIASWLKRLENAANVIRGSIRKSLFPSTPGPSPSRTGITKMWSCPEATPLIHVTGLSGS